MVELPFRSPLRFEAACFCESVGDGHWFVFAGDKLLVELGPPERPSDDPRFRARPAFARLPDSRALRKNHNPWGSEPARTLYLGRLNGIDCWAAELPTQAPAPAGLAWEGLRPLFSVLDDDHFALAGRALQLVDWDRNHQFCGRCGTPTVIKAGERARECPSCGQTHYPRIAPAVMALIRRGDELLLARSPHLAAMLEERVYREAHAHERDERRGAARDRAPRGQLAGQQRDERGEEGH